MAPIRVGCSSRTEQTVRRFSPDISFNPILLLGFCIETFYAIIWCIFRLIAQTGRKLLARDKNLSYSSEVYDSEAWNPYLCPSKSDLKQNNPQIRMDDRQKTALESGSAKINSFRLDHRDNSDKTLHGIQNIVSLQANCGSKNLDIAAAKTKENISFLRGLVPSFWTAGTSEISSNKGTELGNEDVNFEVPLTGKTMKVPEEHTCIDWSCYQPETLKVKTTSCDTDQPSDAGTTQVNSGDTGQKGGQTIQDTGKTAAQVSKSQDGGNNYRRSSGSSGGDDGEDGPRQNVPVGSCQGDSQCSVDTSKEHEQQLEEQSQQGGDSMTIPSSTGNGQDKTGTSNPKEGQAPTDEGTSAAQVSKSLTVSYNHFCSSLSSGEDAKDDSQRQTVFGCQKVSPSTADDSKEHENQPEESIPASVLSDTGNSKDKTGTSNQKEVQATTGGGKQAGQVSKTKQESTNYCRSSSGSGGDDGGEDRKRNLPPGGCQGDGHCEVDVLDETNPSEKDDQEEEQSLTQKTENSLVGAPSFDGTKRSAAQGLRIDVTGARMIAEAACKSQSEVAGGLSLIDQFKCCHPEADLTEAEQRLQQAFTCRHHLNSENEWKECSEASCQEIQEYLYHSQNCNMRVLGGCKKCTCYKDSLLYHTSRCHLPMGACVVSKCDIIREYLMENELPNNRKWRYQLDQLFFKASPPTTPTSSPEKGDRSNEHFTAQLLQAAYSSRSGACDDGDDDDDDDNNLDHQSLIGDESQTSPIEESLRESSGVWNHYHVDRPPELLPPADQHSDLQLTRVRSSDTQVTRGPTVNSQVRLEEHVGDVQVESTTPISAACIPDVRQTVKQITQEEKGELIWPLDQRVLSVSDDGSYIEGIHWRRVKYIGGGSCGRCFYCEDTQTGFLFAIKRIPVGKFQQVEIDTWGSISGQHPNILELYGAVKYKDTVVIFMEYMEGGSVEEYGKLSEGQALHILGKVISAVEFMHSQRLLHRDIKGGNVLLDATGQKVKLADFGTTIRCDGYLQDNNPRGTEAFMAPEVCRSEQHSFSADIWGIMCFLYQMLVGKPPWMDFCYGSLLFKIGMASQPPQSPACSPEVEDLFSQGFVLQPSERATAAELLRHRVFVTAPCVSDIQLPSREELWLDEDSSFSINTSDSDTESLISEQSLDVMLTGSVAGNYDDHQEESDSDNDNDGEASDGYNNGSSDMQEPDLLGDEDTRFIEGPWQGLDLSAEEQLQSLQCELFLNLEGQDLERALNEIEENTDVNDNDINLLRGEDFHVDHFIDELLGDTDMSSTQPLSEVFASSEWSYSITDLTKLHINDSNGNLVFTIRERPSTSYGKLAEDHHGNIASVLELDAFTLTREDGAPLNVRAEIGFEEHAVRVVPAHDPDNWQPYRWRVDIYGRVEEFFEI